MQSYAHLVGGSCFAAVSAGVSTQVEPRCSDSHNLCRHTTPFWLHREVLMIWRLLVWVMWMLLPALASALAQVGGVRISAGGLH